MNNIISTFKYEKESASLRQCLNALSWDDERATRVHAEALSLVDSLRAKKKTGMLESFLQDFTLDTEEGLAVMTLAEALLRIPDTHTANALIRDKVAAAEWLGKQGSSRDWMTKAASLGMKVSKRALDSVVGKLGEPLVREAMVHAMRVMGKQFVLGTSIEDACSNASAFEKKGYRMSYDILGEGARDAVTAERYFKAYHDAVSYIGQQTSSDATVRPGISVKLSALHPRYEISQQEDCLPMLVEKLTALAENAAKHNLSMTIDAEEVARLDLSYAVLDALISSDVFPKWDKFGLALQAYQKASFSLISDIANFSQKYGERLQVRLVKGAYWDTEIKIAQMGGYPDYPVYTRKCNTDVSFLACADEMLRRQSYIYPMFATHNAHSVAAVLDLAKYNDADFELQRLFGMGEQLFDHVLEQGFSSASIYAPVGPHKDLLPYLVRRLLENGANSSFVHKIMNPDVPPEDIVRDPVKVATSHKKKRHPAIPVPRKIFHDRANSKGVDLDDDYSSSSVVSFIQSYQPAFEKSSIIGGKKYPAEVGDEMLVRKSFMLATQGFEAWTKTDVNDRAHILERIADLYEDSMNELMAICVHEAGKTIPDAVAEVREAVDFCRYYAQQARDGFSSEGELMPGYTGETNRLTLIGRGVFVCISPWNFPLAIFTGQVVAALVAGNAVVAKPAEQTPHIALRAVELMLQAGVPAQVLQLVQGSGVVGAKLVAHKDVSGVTFTGSTAAAKSIQRALAIKDGPIVPLIAETGGLNAMIVDSSALLEQVVDDVIYSAFGSAGQRCSALRVVYVQNEIADDFIPLLAGAMKELRVGDPKYLSSDIGPVIDEDALSRLHQHEEFLEENGSFIAHVPVQPEKLNNRCYFAPVAYEIADIGLLQEEVFGPVLHVIRYRGEQAAIMARFINERGYGLTFGVHSRVQTTQNKLARAVRAGNIYVNRSMTGAIVGVQPFGGMGLSGTGPKAGGPHYLPQFATEKVVTIDTTASGGNASLVSLEEEE